MVKYHTYEIDPKGVYLLIGISDYEEASQGRPNSSSRGISGTWSPNILNTAVANFTLRKIFYKRPIYIFKTAKHNLLAIL